MVSSSSDGGLVGVEHASVCMDSGSESGSSDDMLDRDTSPYGSDALGWANKCLQNALVRLLSGSERNAALAYFRQSCANDASSGHGAGSEERANFVRVLWTSLNDAEQMSLSSPFVDEI